MSVVSLEASVEERLSNLRVEAQQRRPPPVTIFRVPPFVRKGNPAAYEPRMVSIGPYYHGADGLRAMEDHKWCYLRDLLSRGASGVSSSSLIQEMRSLEVQVRSCYNEQSLLDSDNFIQMLLLDGCFILEFFFKRHTKEPDALCDVPWGLTILTSDLLLLGNQIPFFVVKKLHDALTGVQGGSRESLHSLFLGVQGHATESLPNLFLEHISGKEPIARPAAIDEIQHLLHLYYISFVPRRWPPSLDRLALLDSSASLDRPASPASLKYPDRSALLASPDKPPSPATAAPSPGPSAVRNAAVGVIPPATELCKAGVTIVRRSSARDMFDISFDGDRGIMEIPTIDMKGPLLVNLITFEQSQRSKEARVVSGYASLMGMLVHTSQDVELLYRRGILTKADDEEEVIQFFTHLEDGGTTNYDRQFFAVLYEDVRRYYCSWQHRNGPLEYSMSSRLHSVHRQYARSGRGQQQFTIFRVPSCFRKRNPTTYEPTMISIGPYFHGTAGLRAVEDLKWEYLYGLMCRKHSPEVNMSALIEEMRSLEPRARACYSEHPALGSDDFVRMLLLDSSFILEHCNKISTAEPETLCNSGWANFTIRTDLILLENQIPFFVLERLFNIIFGAEKFEQFIEVLIWRLGGKVEQRHRVLSESTEIKHLLHLYYISMVPTPSREEGATQNPTVYGMTCISELLHSCYMPPQNQQEQMTKWILPRATEMSEAGVTFKLRTTARDMFDVTFDRTKGIMEIPEFTLHESRLPRLTNLLAFEQTLGYKTCVLVSYVNLMRQMLCTGKDVELLRKRRIFVNALADDEEAARFFGHLGDGASMDFERLTYKVLYTDLQRYCESWRHKSRALLMRDYFGNPWTAISVVVAAILLTLTAVQTYFTVFPR
ncbi:hypothetical protein ACP70R_030861 [Stipagrostis hirtigluma subsp. patula]